jgi:hypothetical protein
MHHFRRICRSLARLTGPPGTVDRRASQLTGPPPHRAGRPGRDGFAGRLIQDVAAAASVAAGHQLGQPDHRTRPAGGQRRAVHPPSGVPSAAPTGRNWPAATATMSRWRTVTPPGLLPRTVQLCIHCRQNPAGFWVRGHGGQTARRPWCLSCCQRLDRDRCDVNPFGS